MIGHKMQSLNQAIVRAAVQDSHPVEMLVPVTPNVAREFGKSSRTVKRWIADPHLGFPKPITMKRRLYIARAELEAFKRRILASVAA